MPRFNAADKRFDELLSLQKENARLQKALVILQLWISQLYRPYPVPTTVPFVQDLHKALGEE
jgi:hypothetical protein